MSAKLRYDHKANDVNCPFREKYEIARNNARSKTTTTNQRAQANTSRFAPTPPLPPPRVSFADSMRNTASSSSRAPFSATTTTRNTQPQANTNNRSNNMSTITNANNNVWSFEECANILFDSVERLQQCKTKFEQLKVIADLLKHACN